ncbi:MAG: lipase [Nocardia sp.]|uniref:alpha/beta hydrolase n=1 Tax=Nocardia sp. TaxID=1821 RepID=UPI0026178F5F|nr:alpha/beta hydrolase [Nocardia sp.]MCU1641980.1 lipase [Nocardia sp.]
MSVLVGIVLGLTLAVAAVVALLCLGAFVSRSGFPGAVAVLVMPTFAPHFVLVGVCAAGIGWWSHTRHPAIGAVLLVLGGVGAVGSAVVTAALLRTVRTAGGSVNPLRSFAIRPMTGAADDTETYATVDGQDLNVEIYRPSGDGVPVLFYIHGGGFTGDTRLPATMRWFADHGWLVIRPEYRLAQPDRPTWDTASADVARAYAWAAEHAGALGGDSERTIVMGESAGGNLALILAYRLASGKDFAVDHLPIPLAVVANYPVVSPQAALVNHILHIDKDIEQYIGGLPARFPERYAVVDCSSYLTPQAPPTLILQGTRDSLVPPESVYDFVTSAEQAGIDVTLVRVPFANHFYDGLAAGSLGFHALTTITHRYLTASRHRSRS